MLNQAHNCPASTFYSAIELSKKTWVVAIMHPARDHPSIHRIKGDAFSDLMVKLRAATRNGERLRCLRCLRKGSSPPCPLWPDSVEEVGERGKVFEAS